MRVQRAIAYRQPASSTCYKYRGFQFELDLARAATVAQDKAADVVIVLEAEVVVVAGTMARAIIEDATPTQYA